jgi:hypothetical protein
MRVLLAISTAPWTATRSTTHVVEIAALTFSTQLPSIVFPYTAPKYRKPDSRRARLERDARALLAANGIFGTVRYEHAASVDDPKVISTKIDGNTEGPWLMDMHRSRQSSGKAKKATKAGTSRKELRKAGLRSEHEFTHEPRKRGKCMVSRDGDRLICSHPGWMHGTICWHIRSVMRQLGLIAKPYSLARRRKPTLWLYEHGYSEASRRSNARKEQLARGRQIIAELCDRHINPPPRVGRTGVPLKAVAYALRMKVFLNIGYDTLLGLLKGDRVFGHFALNWFDDAPSVQTLCNRFGPGTPGAPQLETYLDTLITITASPGREIETLLRIDSDQIPTIMCDNSRDRKFAGPRPVYRSGNEMGKRQLAVGYVTKLVAAARITLNHGIGSGDGPQAPALTKRSQRAMPRIKQVAADRSYGLKANFKRCEGMKVDLYVPERANERRIDAKKAWPQSAQRLAQLQHDHPELFHEVTRKRSDVEGTFSSMKRRNPHLRLRARHNDRQPVYPAHLHFNDDDELDEKISGLDEDTIDAILFAATTAVGTARLNEALATILVSNVRHLVTLEHLFDQRVDFSNPEFAFTNVRLVQESNLIP